MDDLGAEHLSELSGGPTTTPPKSKEHSQFETITPVLQDLSLDSSDEGKEKADATPENIKKIDDVITTLPNANEVIITSANTLTGVSPVIEGNKNEMDESSTISQKSAMAFTIDFGGNSDNSLAEQQAAKYKNMVERFQNRHKRGASMSKLESPGESAVTTPAVAPTPPQPAANTTAAKVKMRIRERSTSGVRDSSKRHSWSPRSSTHEASAPPVLPSPPSKVTAKNTVNIQKSLPIKKPLPPLRKKDSGPQSSFTPKSLAMQKAMEKFELYLPEPPLISNGKNLGEADGISEAGESESLLILFKRVVFRVV